MKYCILIVDDHEDTRAILRAMLNHNGYDIAEAETAEEMFERLEKVKPDLIVLDIRLPGMDGCAALQQLRASGVDIPVFLFSEYYDLFSERIRSCRPDGFFPKSKGPVPLLDGVRAKLPPRSNGNGAVA